MASIQVKESQTVTAVVQLLDQKGAPMGVYSESFAITVVPSESQIFEISLSEDVKVEEAFAVRQRIIRLED